MAEGTTYRYGFRPGEGVNREDLVRKRKSPKERERRRMPELPIKPGKPKKKPSWKPRGNPGGRGMEYA